MSILLVHKVFAFLDVGEKFWHCSVQQFLLVIKQFSNAQWTQRMHTPLSQQLRSSPQSDSQQTEQLRMPSKGWLIPDIQENRNVNRKMITYSTSLGLYNFRASILNSHGQFVSYILKKDFLTGLVIIAIMAFGQTSAIAFTISRTMDAFVLNKSSLVMPAIYWELLPLFASFTKIRFQRQSDIVEISEVLI
ncbi:hypothetical protein MAR_007737 [Mya arenaria]|uniref:Uncharacterized protein n=1 Tax=Mya arenaria TaxID=6604 RepID=A0ABY7DVT8_MYAAR|nr:hypothetical protein MAR_007737 [Mya arenaria]